MSLFIGIDSGTQSTKGVLLDLESGEVIAQARAVHSLIQGLPAGHMEQHPADWAAAMDKVILQILRNADRSRVRGIGISGQQHGFVPLDGHHDVIRPAKLWCDTSTTAECALLTKKLGGEKAVIRRSGLPFLPGYTAPKILWLKRHEPAHFKKLRHVLLPHDYLNYHLTGKCQMEYGDASGTALLDIRRRRWSPETLAAIDPRLADFLPAVTDSDVPNGRLRPDRARQYGLSEEVLVSAGGGDNMMGAIGTGNVAPGVVTASFGTSGTIYAHATKPAIDPRGEVAAFCGSTGGWLPLVCTMNVTGVTERIRELFKFDHAGYDAAVSAVPAGAAGLTLLPYFAGERTPNLPTASGVLLGLTGATASAPQLARAAMEGATLGMNYGLRRLQALGIRPREVRVTGGGARSPIWRQIMADVFGVPTVAMKEDEGAALGGAIQAAWCFQRAEGNARAKITELTGRLVAVDAATRCTPDRARLAHYRKLQQFHDELSLALAPTFKKHRALLS